MIKFANFSLEQFVQIYNYNHTNCGNASWELHNNSAGIWFLTNNQELLSYVKELAKA